jgi:hypothetical protein
MSGPEFIWDRMRAAADTMETARLFLPKGYSPEYQWDIETLRSFADKWEADAANIRLRNKLMEFLESAVTSPYHVAEELLRNYDITPKAVS